MEKRGLGGRTALLRAAGNPLMMGRTAQPGIDPQRLKTELSFSPHVAFFCKPPPTGVAPAPCGNPFPTSRVFSDCSATPKVSALRDPRGTALFPGPTTEPPAQPVGAPGPGEPSLSSEPVPKPFPRLVHQPQGQAVPAGSGAALQPAGDSSLTHAAAEPRRSCLSWEAREMATRDEKPSVWGHKVGTPAATPQ